MKILFSYFSSSFSPSWPHHLLCSPPCVHLSCLCVRLLSLLYRLSSLCISLFLPVPHFLALSSFFFVYISLLPRVQSCVLHLYLGCLFLLVVLCSWWGSNSPGGLGLALYFQLRAADQLRHRRSGIG